MKKKPGRPRKYDSPAQFDEAVGKYVALCKETNEPITWTGLALALGFATREAIDTYLEYDGFSDSVKRAKLIVQNAYEKRLAGTTPTGAIFALKNFGWHDKQEVQADVTHRTLAQALADLNGRASKD